MKCYKSLLFTRSKTIFWLAISKAALWLLFKNMGRSILWFWRLTMFCCLLFCCDRDWIFLLSVPLPPQCVPFTTSTMFPLLLAYCNLLPFLPTLLSVHMELGSLRTWLNSSVFFRNLVSMATSCWVGRFIWEFYCTKPMPMFIPNYTGIYMGACFCVCDDDFYFDCEVRCININSIIARLY